MAASILCWDLGFTEDQARVMCNILDGGSGICRYHCTFKTYESVKISFIISNLQNFIRLNPFSNYVKGDVCDRLCFAWLNPIFCIARVYTNV